MTNLDRIIADAVRRIIRTEGEPAKLGRADGTIRFTDASGTTHRRRKWVRVQRGAEMVELVAYDTVSVPEHTDLPVRVAHRDGSPMIIGTGGLAADEFSGDRTLVPQHSHDRFSYNPHYATGPSFLPLMAIPSSPLAMTVEVQQGWYRYRGDWKHWDTADSSSLASYTPAPGFHHFIVLCLDRENNALAIVDGNDKPAPSAGVPFTADDVDDVTIPDAYRPLCAIRLYNGQVEIRPPDIFMDLRLWGGESPAVYNLPDTENASPEAGDLWFDGGALHFQPASDERSVTLANGVIISGTTVADTVTETTVFTEPVSAGELYLGSKWHTRVSGYFSTANASDTFTIRFKIGGTTIHSFVSTAENVTDGFFRVEWFFTVRSTGATGTVISAIDGIFNTTTKNEANTSTDTIDTTTAEDLTVTIQWSAADAGNTLTVSQGHTDIFGVDQS